MNEGVTEFRVTCGDAKKLIFPAFLISMSVAAGSSYANPLQVSATGVFSQTTISDQVVSPGARWAMQFVIDSSPAVTNGDTLGFDIPSTSFSHQLGGTQVNTAPDEVRFFTAGCGGLFTVYFGPQSGFTNGAPVFESSFEGPQALSGITTNRLFAPGKFTLSTWTSSDANNVDDQAGMGEQITISAPAPEPATMWLTIVAVAGICGAGVRRVKLG